MEQQHPISDLLRISLDNLKDMIDVNTIVGDTITVNERTSIIPISKVKCGFATGGTDLKNSNYKENQVFPFGGATGGTIVIDPVAFLVVINDDVSLLHLENQTHIYEKVIDQIPDTFKQIKDLFSKKKEPKITSVDVIEKKN